MKKAFLRFKKAFMVGTIPDLPKIKKFEKNKVLYFS